MKYLKIDEKHLTTLITWLFDEVLSSGGDGYGLWVSKKYSAKDIHELIISKELFPKGFKHKYNSEYEYYIYYDNQEQLIITNSYEFMDYNMSSGDVKLIY